MFWVVIFYNSVTSLTPAKRITVNTNDAPALNIGTNYIAMEIFIDFGGVSRKIYLINIYTITKSMR